jgi:hypothetical protein
LGRFTFGLTLFDTYTKSAPGAISTFVGSGGTGGTGEQRPESGLTISPAYSRLSLR